MRAEEIKRELLVRYFRWALAEWDREIQEDFPLLRSVAAETAYGALAFLGGLSESQKREFAVAVVHLTTTPQERAALGIVPTAAQVRLHRAYLGSFERDSSPEAFRRSRDSKKNVRALREALLSRLGFLGAPKRAPGELSYLTPLPGKPWQLYSEADWSGDFNGFRLRQCVGAGEDWVLWNQQLLEWLGLGPTEIVVIDGDVATAAETADRLVEHFLAACQKLLEGLDWPDPASPS